MEGMGEMVPTETVVDGATVDLKPASSIGKSIRVRVVLRVNELGSRLVSLVTSVETAGGSGVVVVVVEVVVVVVVDVEVVEVGVVLVEGVILTLLVVDTKGAFVVVVVAVVGALGNTTLTNPDVIMGNPVVVVVGVVLAVTGLTVVKDGFEGRSRSANRLINDGELLE